MHDEKDPRRLAQSDADMEQLANALFTFPINIGIFSDGNETAFSGF